DVGSGTGILTEPLLARGHVVYAVEPNAGMRAAAEARLTRYTRFHSIAGRAEATTLANASVHLAVAAQAFHWFDPAAARQEFMRILRPGGWVALAWNTRRTTSAFLAAYEQLLQRFGTDYAEVNHERIDRAVLAGFFGKRFETTAFDNRQECDFEALKGRL